MYITCDEHLNVCVNLQKYIFRCKLKQCYVQHKCTIFVIHQMTKLAFSALCGAIKIKKFRNEFALSLSGKK